MASVADCPSARHQPSNSPPILFYGPEKNAQAAARGRALAAPEARRANRAPRWFLCWIRRSETTGECSLRRQRRWRQRRATGVRVLAVPVDEYKLAIALIEAGRVDPVEAMSPSVLAREASDILAEL